MIVFNEQVRECARANSTRNTGSEMNKVLQASHRSPTDPSGVTGKLSIWLAGLKPEDIPASTKTRAKHLMLDGLACALVGAQLPWSQRAMQVVRQIEGSGSGSVIGCGCTVPIPASVLLNGTFIQGFELDDYHFLGPLHSNAVVLPSLFGVTQELGHVRGEDFLGGAIAGYEVGPRVGMALHGLQMLSRGWHSGSVFGTHASAAAAGALYGLDAAGFEDALGIAGNQSSGLMGAQFEAMVKRMNHGFSARNGFYAAALAAGGYTGIKRVYEREYGGFLSTFGEGHAPDANQLTNRLGELWETERISIKPYAAMTAHHASLDAILELKRQHQFRANDIVNVDIGLAHALYHHGYWQIQRPITETAAQMHIGYSVAAAIIDGSALIEQYTPTRIASDDVWELIPKIRAHHEQSFDALPKERQLGAHVVIELKGGRRLEMTVPAPRGHQSLPLSNEDIRNKYRVLTASVIESDRQRSIEDAVLNIEALNDVSDLITLLAPVTRPAFT
jgi:aconitate decarboxylase